MYKFFNYCLFCFVLVFVWNCATGPSSIEFTSAKTKARSERNLKDAEMYALQALDSPIHATDARVPYFLATEIYKPQKKWDLVYKMLEEAMSRDPEAKLETPVVYKEKVITQMSEAIENYYKNELWYIMYNNAVTVSDTDRNKAIELLLLSIKLDPLNLKSHILLSKIYKLNNQTELSLKYIDQALKFGSLINSEQKAELYLIKGDISRGIKDYDNAIKYNELAYAETQSTYALIELLNLNLLAEDFLEAKQWGEIAYEELYSIDAAFIPSVLFNIGLAYRYVATTYYDLGVDVIDKLNENKNVSRSELEDCKNNFEVALEHFDLSRDYFLESHDEQIGDSEEEWETDASQRADQTKDYMKQIKKTLLPFINTKISNFRIEE